MRHGVRQSGSHYDQQKVESKLALRAANGGHGLKLPVVIRIAITKSPQVSASSGQKKKKEREREREREVLASFILITAQAPPGFHLAQEGILLGPTA